MRAIVTWVVQPGDATTVADVVRETRAAGRIFLNGRPADLDEEVRPGDRVEIFPKREVDTSTVSILAQRDGIVLAYKPAGLPTETTQAGSDSLVTELVKRLKGGRVHAASRLDVGVSGVVACTLGSDASRRINELRRRGQVARTYVAIASGLTGSGVWQVPVGRQRDRGGRVRAVREGTSLAEATTRYETLAATQKASFLRLLPQTGRLHQLRAHAAFAGAPLYGDGLYGGPRSVVLADGRVLAIDRIALHALSVELPQLSAHAPLPPQMAALWRDLGGDLPEL